MTYDTFLARKAVQAAPVGFHVAADDLGDHLFPFQRRIVSWALSVGRAAVFADTGLGKTRMQLTWADRVAKFTGGRVLILAPLAVADQTVREAEAIGIKAGYARRQEDVAETITVTNYEMLGHFDAGSFAGVVLDESSILKSFMGKTKRAIIEAFAGLRFKLACTATPAPNDHVELGNHADFLDVMPANEMLSRWFINDTMSAGNYRLKGHAAGDFWRWVASWAISVTKPSDLGDFDDTGYVLPGLHIFEHTVAVDHSRAHEDGKLLKHGDLSATELHREMRETNADRCAKVAELVTGSDESWIVWCNTNYEADELVRLLPDAIEVRGSETVDAKQRKLRAFTAGEARIIITKPSIAGFGLNWQHCHNMAFVGLSYGYEDLYQALRRSYRFGQTREVNAHLICAESEVGVMETLRAKEAAHRQMQLAMAAAMREAHLEVDRTDAYAPITTREAGEAFTVWQGDCVEVAQLIEPNSVDFSVYSPPFANLYIYSADVRDMGNSADDDEFFDHYRYLIREKFRITKPGRLTAVHCKDLPTYAGRDGAAGMKDFPGRIIREHEAAGWVYHSRVTIWKDPVIEMQRTKSHGLLHKNFTQRTEACRQGMPDYLLVFRKWTPDMPDGQVNQRREPGDYIGENPPIGWTDNRDYSIQVWQRYASPVWFDIQQTNVLNIQQAREGQDEKHICPLQLDVIARSIDLWTNKGDLVFTPFLGIGSELYQAIKMGRRGMGSELKPSYFEVAVRNLREAERESRALTLFDSLA